jgi:sugar lactone lactonase YvrE
MRRQKRVIQSTACTFCLVVILALSGTMPSVTGEVEPGPEPEPAHQHAASNGTISGIVTDDNGTPLAGIGVGAGDYDTLVDCGGADHWAGTAADGSFQLDMPPGTYLVFVNSHPYPDSYLPEAYCDINSWHVIAQATPIGVTAGQVVTGVDFSIPSGFSLSGRLVDDHGQPVLGAGGHIENLNGTVEYGCALGFGSSDSDGTFRVNVPAGIYDLFFGTMSEGHTVVYGLIVTQTLDLGDVLFAEGSQPSGPRPLEPGYTADWFVAPGAFNMPQEIMPAPDGDLYVLAVRSQILYRLAAGGAITPVATGLAAYLGDVDAAGNVYLHGHPQGILYRVAPDGTKTVVVQSPELQAACDSGFGLGPDGNLYLARDRCTDTSTLLRITPAGTITPLADGLPVIVALRTAPDGRFLAAADNRVYALSLSDYALTLLGQIPTCCIAPGGLAVDSSGNIYLSTGARIYGGELYRVAPSGQVTLLADIPVNGLSGLESLAGTQEVVGGQLRQGAVLAVSTSGAIRELVPGNGLVSPMGMAFAPDGTLAVANDDGGMMARVSPQGDVAWFFDYISFTPPEPFVAYAPDGTLYAGEGAPGFAGRIIHLPPGAAAPAPWIDVDWPSGLVREASGAMLVSETKAGRITHISPDLMTATIATDLLFPQALALNAAGQLYVVTGKGSAQLRRYRRT